MNSFDILAIAVTTAAADGGDLSLQKQNDPVQGGWFFFGLVIP
jgi:hypothetical protein